VYSLSDALIGLKLGRGRVGEILHYASFPDGRLWATVIFYKEL
jgi:hypothetical protein